MKKTLVLLFLFFLFPVYSKAPQQILRINMGAEPPCLDPRKGNDLTSHIVMKMIFEGLMRIEQDEVPQNALAESYTVSDDRLHYVFFLKKAKWSNGDPVTAGDFVASWKETLHPNFPSPVAHQLYVIANGKKAKEGTCSLEEVGVKALDEKTLQVDLEFPSPYFLHQLATPAFFPVNANVVRRDTQWAERKGKIVCNGPFKINNWKTMDIIEFVPNHSYWDRNAVRLKKIEAVIVDETTGLMMFENHELDLTGSPLSIIPVDAIANLKKKGTLQKESFIETFFIALNTAVPVLGNCSMRKALGYAIDRQEIVDHILQGGQLPTTGLVPIVLGLQEAPYFRDGDREEAKRLFDEAIQELKITRKDLEKHTLFYIGTGRNHLVAQEIQEQWSKVLGFRIGLQATERKTYFEKMNRKEYDLAISSCGSDYRDPLHFLKAILCNEVYGSERGWHDEKYRVLVEKAERTADREERLALLREAEKRLMEGMPLIPINNYTQLYVQSEKVKDIFVPSTGRIDFKWAHIEP